MELQAKPDWGLWRYRTDLPGGKYVVLRRDGTVFDEPNFVLGSRDPATPVALRAYARACREIMERRADGREIYSREYLRDLYRLAGEIEWMQAAAQARGEKPGDPGKGRHRRDHPLVIEQMRHPDRRILAPSTTDEARQA